MKTHVNLKQWINKEVWVAIQGTQILIKEVEKSFVVELFTSSMVVINDEKTNEKVIAPVSFRLGFETENAARMFVDEFLGGNNENG